MLLKLSNTDSLKLQKFMDYAIEIGIHLSVIDESHPLCHEPSSPLNEADLENLILHARKSGSVELEYAHQLIRSKYENPL